ncbi:MAG: hypothetical protein PF569_09880 [Candidatus Woesearchaeota archaeon]|jgi:hypothetical protein|nr:hypothetical protein [Candidatus Woesearchaeota archaeon]
MTKKLKQVEQNIALIKKVLEPQMRIADAISKSTRPFNQILQTYNNTFEQIRIQIRGLDNLTTTLNSISNSVKPIQLFFEKQQNLFDNLAKALQLDKEINDSDFEYKWVGCIGITDRKKLYELWKAEKYDEMMNFFEEWINTDEQIQKIIDDLKANPLFEKRVKIIESAIKSHNYNLYETSIPTLLSQIDGIFIEQHKNLNGTISFSFKCEECGHKIKKYPPLTTKAIVSYLGNKEHDYFNEYILHIYNLYDETRNEILHGKRLDYASKELSLKLIITIIELHYETIE